MGEYRTLLVEEARRGTTLDDKNAKELFQTLLANPLAHVIEGGRGPHDRHVIVLDALDEAVDADGRSDLLTLVSSEFGKLPSWLGLMVTSRPEAPVIRQLSQFGVHALKADDPRNLKDVQTYTQNWLRKLEIDVTHRKAALEAVLQAGQGNFLYVRQLEAAVSEVIVTPDQLLLSAGLPSGLAALYERWFLHRFTDQETYECVQRPLLELMMAAREPLPLQLAGHILGWGSYGQGKALKPLGSLCVQTSLEEDKAGTITFFHKSLRDWLADEFAAGPDWHASEVEGQRVLAEHLCQEYKRWKMTPVIGGVTCFEELGYSGKAYALRQFPSHLRLVSKVELCSEVLGDLDFAKARSGRGNELSISEDYRTLDFIGMAHALACHNLMKLDQRLQHTLSNTLIRAKKDERLDCAAALYAFAALMLYYEEGLLPHEKVSHLHVLNYLKCVDAVFRSILTDALTLEELEIYGKLKKDLDWGMDFYS